MSFSLPKLEYSYDALEPHIDARTMEIHHSKHHQGYTNKLNAAIEGSENESKDIHDILSGLDMTNMALRNNAGGYYNHKIFWEVMNPNKENIMSEDLKTAIDEAFGSFEAFKEAFSKAAATRFGSGWAWLSLTSDGLKVHRTPNQDNPLMSYSEIKGDPIIGMDVWEHAYYLKHKSQRAKYIDDFFKVLCWRSAEKRYQQIING